MHNEAAKRIGRVELIQRSFVRTRTDILLKSARGNIIASSSATLGMSALLTRCTKCRLFLMSASEALMGPQGAKGERDEKVD